MWIVASRSWVNPLCLGVAVLWTWLAIAPTQCLATDWAARNQEYQQQIQPLLQKTCHGCHSGAEADAGLSLAHFTEARAIFRERSIWEKVAQRLEIGDMPPKDADPLSDADRKRLIEWIRSTLNDIDCGRTPNPGAVTLRRLNRSEYRNTIKDLFKVDYEPAAGFPGDDVGYGFDNIGDVLTLPPLLMEKYVRAAEEISQKSILAPAPGPVFDSPHKLAQFKSDGKGGGDPSVFVFASNGEIAFDEQIPWSGKYTLEAGMAGSAAQGQYPKVVISVDGKKVHELTVQTETHTNPKAFSIPLKLKAGKRSIELAFVNDKYIEGKNGAPHQDTNLYIFDLKVVGQKPPEPLREANLPVFHREVVKDAVPSATRSVGDAASEVLRKVASRAYRRPVTEEELKRLTGLVTMAVEEGDAYESGLQLAITAILVSPNFLFKVEDNQPRVGESFPLLSEYELATRLSYFLWSSTPDRELLSLAAKQQLRQPRVLRQQVARMIADDRARDFVRNFAGQWLTLRKLDNIVPSNTLYPDWNEEIRDLARTETYLLVLQVMRDNVSILRLLDADYSFMNQKLAAFYGVPGVQGDKFQKVSLKGQKRMGILTHASVLAVTSNPTRTSPVKRGKWILDNVLGTPPPPAPAGVPELEKGELVGSLRQQLEQHRANPACASCHKLMDPLGLALENYDAIGRWRTQDRGQAIDSSAELASGENVRGPGELIRVLRDQKSDKFVRNVTEKLLIYGIGRGLEYYDRCAVDKILAAASKTDFAFQDLVYEIVISDPFQRKGTRDEP